MLWAIIVAVLFALDQITKTYVKNNLPLGQSNK